MKLSFFLILSLISSFSFSQNANIFHDLNTLSSDQGGIIITQNADIRQAITDYSNKKGDEKGLNGYRIQIYFGTGHSARKKATDIRNKFIATFKDQKAHLIYQSPYFKVRIGDFRTRSEALKIMGDIKATYSGAFIVKDYIDFPILESLK